MYWDCSFEKDMTDYIKTQILFGLALRRLEKGRQILKSTRLAQDSGSRAIFRKSLVRLSATFTSSRQYFAIFNY